mmetsp:Transcript_57972/g.152691  ORF Transcript_57972/g.152691 Transcript_57972/m.152691 type:complete len:221 (-) Transcript_57972:278-940(-)
MALWFRRWTRPPETENSHAGHRAFAAIWRWSMPTPVAFRNSSMPSVATHCHSPASPAAGGFAGGGAAAGSGVAAPPASASASASAMARRSESTTRSSMSWSSKNAGLLFASFAAAGLMSSVLAPSSEGRDRLLLPWRRARCGRTEMRRVPVISPRFVSRSSTGAMATMSLCRGTVTEPQKTSLWKWFLSQTWTVSSTEVPARPLSTSQDALHVGCLCDHL